MTYQPIIKTLWQNTRNFKPKAANVWGKSTGGTG